MIDSVVFAGSPPAAVVVLDALVDAGIRIARVVTQPDARRGRGGALSPTPVKKRALELSLEVSESIDGLVCDNADAAVVVAYGRIIPERILDTMPMINVHFSLLPRWRGAAPVERAILAGDTRTGVCVMRMEPTLDTGPVYARAETDISDLDTSTLLTDRLARMGGEVLVDVLRRWPVTPIPQEGEATYAHKLGSDEFTVDWSTSAVNIARHVRAMPAHTTVRGRRLRLAAVGASMGGGASDCVPGTYRGSGDVQTGEGTLRIETVQPEGKSEMSFDEWARGARIESGFCFGEDPRTS